MLKVTFAGHSRALMLAVGQQIQNWLPYRPTALTFVLFATLLYGLESTSDIQ